MPDDPNPRPPAGWSPSPPLGALLLAMAVSFLLLGAYSLAEWLWLADRLPGAAAQALHIVAGIFAAMLTGAIVVRAMRKADAPSILRPARFPTSRLGARGHDALLPSHLRWMVRMRWLTTGAVLILGSVATLLVPVIPADRLPAFLVAVCMLAAGNIFFSRRSETAHDLHSGLRWQVVFDLVVLTFLLQQTGGAENPLYIAYGFHVVVSGILLAPAEARSVAWLASALLLGEAVLELVGVLPHHESMFSPHGLHEPVVDPIYVLPRVGIATVAFHLLAALVSTVAQDLRAREAQLESVFEASPAGIGLRDLSGRVVWGNPRFHDWRECEGDILAGLDPAEVVGEMTHISPAGRRGAVSGSVERVAAAQTEGSAVASDGRILHYAILSAPVIGWDGAPTHVIDVIEDLTGLKDAQAQLMLAGKMAAIGELSGRIAHEINNPVGVIRAKASLLLRADLPTPVQDELRKIADLADRATSIAQNLLAMARPPTRPKGPFRLGPQIRMAFGLVEGLLAKQAIEAELDLPPGLPKIVASEEAVGQVLLNLFKNAIHVMPDGGELRVSLERMERGDRKMQVIRVADSGPGIEPALRQQIFEPFFSTKPFAEGTGLGLSISLDLVREYGGTLEVENSPSGGARFSVFLPEEVREHERDDVGSR